MLWDASFFCWPAGIAARMMFGNLDVYLTHSSSGLGYCPLTAATPVQNRYGLFYPVRLTAQDIVTFNDEMMGSNPTQGISDA